MLCLIYGFIGQFLLIILSTSQTFCIFLVGDPFLSVKTTDATAASAKFSASVLSFNLLFRHNLRLNHNFFNYWWLY